MEGKGLGHSTTEQYEFVANMECVLDVYKRPYDKDYPVVCVDESPKQLIEEMRPETAISAR